MDIEEHHMESSEYIDAEEKAAIKSSVILKLNELIRMVKVFAVRLENMPGQESEPKKPAKKPRKKRKEKT